MKKTTIAQLTHLPQSLLCFKLKRIAQIKLLFFFVSVTLLLFNSHQSFAQADQKKENTSITNSRIDLVIAHEMPTSVVKAQQQLKSLRAERAVSQRALKKATALQRQEQIVFLQSQIDDIDAKTQASLKVIYQFPEERDR